MSSDVGQVWKWKYSFGRTTKWSLQVETYGHSLCFEANLHLCFSSPLTKFIVIKYAQMAVNFCVLDYYDS